MSEPGLPAFLDFTMRLELAFSVEGKQGFNLVFDHAVFGERKKGVMISSCASSVGNFDYQKELAYQIGKCTTEAIRDFAWESSRQEVAA